MIVEVTSPSTQVYDRGDQLEQCKKILSLELIALVAHDRTELDMWA